MADGLMLSFLTFFHGTVDPFHLANPLAGNDWRRAYSEGQKLKVRKDETSETCQPFAMFNKA